jgi:DNA-binding CsgD family transcriptional regulator
MNYSLFFEFVETFSPQGFQGILPEHPLILELEEKMEKNDQFFYFADIIRMKNIYTSKRSIDMIGITPEELSPYHFMEATHPDDLDRLSLGRSKLIKMAQDIYIAGKGTGLISTNFHVRNATGAYSCLLMQNYLYFSETPYKSVYLIKVHTNIDWCKKIKNGFHYYLGTDRANFRYPDEDLMKLSHPFSRREFEIIKLAELGLNTDQIAEKLFLSPYTVNTHRANILKKTGKAHVYELIYDLKFQGLL